MVARIPGEFSACVLIALCASWDAMIASMIALVRSGDPGNCAGEFAKACSRLANGALAPVNPRLTAQASRVQKTDERRSQVPRARGLFHVIASAGGDAGKSIANVSHGRTD